MADTTQPPCPGVTHQTVDAEGLAVHVATAGPEDGPPVVLLHGWPQHWWMWHDVIPALAGAGHRVLAVDLRGHGWTAAPERGYEKEQLASDVLATLDALGIDRFALAGHDWGGWTAQLVALRAPGRVARLAILNIPPVFTDARRTVPQLWRFAHVAINSSPWFGAAWQRTPLMRLAFLGVPETDRPVYAERFKHPERARAAQQLYRTFLVREMPALLRDGYDDGRLRMPTLVLHGDADPVIRPGLLAGFRDHADDLRIELVHGAGHFVVDERPDVVVPRLTAWFGEGR